MPPKPNESDWHQKLQQLSAQLRVSPEERWRADVAVNCFRQGSPPQEGIEELTVGMGSVTGVFAKELQRAHDGACSFTLVEGEYGAGKSHALHILRERAFAAGFVVSFVTLSQRECPLSDLGLVYSGIVSRIEGRTDAGITSLHDLLEVWAENTRRCGSHSEEKAKRSIRCLDPDFQVALAEFIGRPSEDRAELAERWLSGIDRTKTTARRLKVSLRATNEHGLSMLKELGKMVCSLGFKGLVVLFDEAEAIPAYSTAAHRQQCYENLCRLLDRSNRVPHCYFVYATTPLFFSNVTGHVPVSRSSGEVVSIPPLSRHDCLCLGRMIRDLYMKGEGLGIRHDSVDNTQIAKCIDDYLARCLGNVNPRSFVRSLVAALDVSAQNRSKKLSEVFAWCKDE